MASYPLTAASQTPQNPAPADPAAPGAAELGPLTPTPPSTGASLPPLAPCVCSGDCCGDLICAFAGEWSSLSTGEYEGPACRERADAASNKGAVEYGCLEASLAAAEEKARGDGGANARATNASGGRDAQVRARVAAVDYLVDALSRPSNNSRDNSAAARLAAGGTPAGAGSRSGTGGSGNGGSGNGGHGNGGSGNGGHGNGGSGSSGSSWNYATTPAPSPFMPLSYGPRLPASPGLNNRAPTKACSGTGTGGAGNGGAGNGGASTGHGGAGNGGAGNRGASGGAGTSVSAGRALPRRARRLMLFAAPLGAAEAPRGVS